MFGAGKNGSVLNLIQLLFPDILQSSTQFETPY